MIETVPLALAWAQSLQAVGAKRAETSGLTMALSCIIDTVGVTLAGSQQPAVRILCGSGISAAGESTLLGLSERRALLDAALINGTAAHAIDYDDMAKSLGGHPSVILLPVVLGLAEELDLSGEAVLDAFIVGFEAECRIGLCVHPHHYNQGWHPTSTLGIFGAAAAAARLLQLSVDQTAVALSLAASMASGVKANFGSMTKPFHVGHASRSGMLAALLARDGFTANLSAIDGPQGFFAAYDGLANIDSSRLVTPPNASLEVERETVGLKQFPCCGSTHPAILAAMKLRAEFNPRPAEIEAIDIRIHPQRIPHTDNPSPQSALGAKFSQQYAVARALVSGAPRIADFEGDAFRQPEVTAILPKIALVPTPGEGRGVIDEMAAQVDFRLADGTLRSARIDGVLGRGPGNPMSRDELWDKFSDCGGIALADEKLRAGFDMLADLRSVRSARELCRTLSAG